MNNGVGVGIGTQVDLQQEIAIKIAAVCAADIAQERDLVVALEKAIDMGIYEREADGDTCPNCNSLMIENFCPVCNQEKNDPDLLDNSEDKDERECDDLSDSEDADDDPGENDEKDDNLSFEKRNVNLRDSLEGYLRDEGISDDLIPLYLYLAQEMLSLKNVEFDGSLPDKLIADASQCFDISADEIKNTWENKPFTIDEIEILLQECLSGTTSLDEFKEDGGVFLEIRKIGDDYFPIVNDPYDDLVLNTAKKGEWLQIGDSKRSYSAKLLLKKKEEKNEILYKILETIIACRRDFLDAGNMDAAKAVLEQNPFEQQEVVKRHELDKGTVSRHFSDKVVLTHHGYFTLKDLTKSKALAQDDLTTETIKDIIKMVVEQGDTEKEYLSDQKIAEKIAQNHEMKISREYVRYLRKSLNIKSSRDRQRLANNRKYG